MQDRMAGAAVVFLLLALPNSYGNTCSQDGAVATILNDPHVRGPFGSTFDFKGEHGCIYSLLSAQHLSFQAKFEHVDFVSPFSKMNVHGAFMREAYAVLDTSKSTRIFVEYGVRQPAVAFIAIGNHKSTITNITNGALKQVDDALVSLSHNTLYVETSKWKLVMEATSGKPHRGVARLNVGVQPTLPLPAILSPVAPHGLLGQLYDGGNVAVHGKRDVYSRLDDGRASNQRTGVGGHVTTRAMGEGAIEGTASDYLLRHKFETNFTFSRHHNTHAAVRDIRKLHGVKIRAVASKQKLPGRSDMATRKRGRELSTICQPTSPPVAPPFSPPPPPILSNSGNVRTTTGCVVDGVSTLNSMFLFDQPEGHMTLLSEGSTHCYGNSTWGATKAAWGTAFGISDLNTEWTVQIDANWPDPPGSYFAIYLNTDPTTYGGSNYGECCGTHLNLWGVTNPQGDGIWTYQNVPSDNTLQTSTISAGGIFSVKFKRGADGVVNVKLLAGGSGATEGDTLIVEATTSSAYTMTSNDAELPIAIYQQYMSSANTVFRMRRIA